MEFSDPAFADALNAWVDARVAAALGEGATRWGTVTSIGTTSCVVDLGDSGTRTVAMHTVRPALVGQEVLIAGPSEARYVADVKGGGYVLGGARPGDMYPALRTPDGTTEVLMYGQTLTGAETQYPVLWANAPSAVKSGSNIVVPDMRGRGLIGRDDMGGSAANRVTNAASGITATTLGAAGGTQTHTLTDAQLPAHTHTVTDPGHVHDIGGGSNVAADGAVRQEPGSSGTKTSGSKTTGISVTGGGSGGAHQNMPPSLVGHWILFLGIPVT